MDLYSTNGMQELSLDQLEIINGGSWPGGDFIRAIYDVGYNFGRAVYTFITN